MFTVSLSGAATTRDEMLQWQAHDRLGIVVTQPLGALGAGLLTLLACTAFYDANRKRRMRPLYPPIFLFHVGRRWGFYGELDFWPDRKERVVPRDPSEVLGAINTAAITHLALPDGPQQEITLRYKEPEEAFDRLRHCFVYSPNGSVQDADIQIATESTAAIENLRRVAFAQETLDIREREVAETPRLRATTPLGLDTQRYCALLRDHVEESDPADPDVFRTQSRLDLALAAGRLVESFRRVEPKAALQLLMPPITGS